MFDFYHMQLHYSENKKEPNSVQACFIPALPEYVYRFSAFQRLPRRPAIQCDARLAVRRGILNPYPPLTTTSGRVM
jgi:hypothetical protein